MPQRKTNDSPSASRDFTTTTDTSMLSRSGFPHRSARTGKAAERGQKKVEKSEAMEHCTDSDDLVSLILTSLEDVNSHDLTVLSLSLAEEASIHLQRLLYLLSSPSQTLTIISFLDGLSLRQRRHLLGRVILRLLRRVTNFLEDHATGIAGSGERSNINDYRVCWADIGNEDAQNSVFESGIQPVSLSRGSNCIPEAGGFSDGRTGNVEGKKICESKRGLTCERLHADAKIASKSKECSTSDVENCKPHGSTLARDTLHGKKQKDVLIGRFGSDLKETTGSKSGGHIGEEMCMELRNGTREVAGPSFESRRVGLEATQINGVADLSRFNFGNDPTRASSNTRPIQGSAHPTKRREMNRTVVVKTSVERVSGEGGRVNGEGGYADNDSEELRQSWGDTDAAFLLLFLSETQEQECLDALKKWCVDPHVYRYLIVRDMAAQVDDKGGLIRAPKWMQSLQEYLLQNILQVGYGVPGMVTSANFPASLSAYIGTIGRFQRLLWNVNGVMGSQQRTSFPPASAATLLSLPTIVIGSGMDERAKLCSICGEEFESATLASQLPCMHVYHCDCILPWLKQRNTCPVCRHELPTDDLDYELHREKQVLLQKAV